MKKWIFIDHIADVCIEIVADTIPEIYQGALEAMNEILYPGFCTNSNKLNPISLKIDIKAVDSTVLLIDFLSEVLYHSHEKKMLFCEFFFHALTSNHLTAKVLGTGTELFKDDIKAVTYHQADLIKNDQGRWTTRIIFDI